MATSAELIRVEHVIKEYNHGAVKTLNDCSLSIKKGEVVAIIGPSGSGKSTLLRCLNLLEIPSSGHIYFNGVDSVSISKRLGHAQVSTTANIYAHVMEAADKKNADILADVFLKKA